MDKQVKILVVDDDNNLRETLADLLEIEGYKVYQAGNGQECLDLVSSEFFNVILMDGYSLQKSLYSMLCNLPPTLSLKSVIATPAGAFFKSTNVRKPI